MPHHRTLYFVLPLIMAFAACKEQRPPSGIIDTATLTDFLYEAHLIESYAYTVASDNRDSLGHYVDAAYDTLFAKHGIDPALFDSSMDYYSHQPLVLEEVYTRISQRLRNQQDSLALQTPKPNININGSLQHRPL